MGEEGERMEATIEIAKMMLMVVILLKQNVGGRRVNVR